MSTNKKNDFQHVAERLAAREAELRAEVAALDAEAADRSGGSPLGQVEDPAEQGEERIRQAVRSAEQERDVLELRDIADARERLSRGTYGECIDCGKSIPLARLEAQPTAARCVPCQERFEQSHPAVRVQLPPMR